MARRVLVTGASGFVGANLARRLLTDGHDVHLVLRPSHQPWRVAELRDSVTVHSVDIDDREGLELAFAAARPEWIFHLAAHGAYPQQRDFDRMIVTNVHGTGHLLATAEQAGFDVLVTSDQNIRYQQNLAGRKLALVALGSKVWPVVTQHSAAIAVQVAQATPGGYDFIEMPLPPKPRGSG